MNSLVSIISPCYNCEKYIDNYLKSLLNQTYSNLEIIMIDDCSTDATYETLLSYKKFFSEKGYKYIILKQESNKGQAAAINLALPLFKGKYMMWMDSDDIMLPQHIEKKVAFLEKNNHKDFLLAAGYLVNCTDLERPLKIVERKHDSKIDDYFSDLIYEKNVVFGPGSILVRKESFVKAIPSLHIFESREGQNWQLMLPLAYCCEFGYIDDPLWKCVVHENSHSRVKKTYKEQVSRIENFEILINETIKNIEQMPLIEKNKWYEKVKIRTYRKKLNLAVENLDWKGYRQCKKWLLKNNEQVSFSEKIFFGILKKISNICRKKKNVQ